MGMIKGKNLFETATQEVRLYYSKSMKGNNLGGGGLDASKDAA